MCENCYQIEEAAEREMEIMRRDFASHDCTDNPKVKALVKSAEKAEKYIRTWGNHSIWRDERLSLADGLRTALDEVKDE